MSSPSSPVAPRLGSSRVAELSRRLVVGPGASTHEVVSPLSGMPLAQLPLSSAADVRRAISTARAAQPDWAATPLPSRAAVLLRLHDLLLAHQVELLDLVQRESGKARFHAFEELADASIVARHYGLRGAAYLRTTRTTGAFLALTQAEIVRQPIGVVGIVTPWNYPLTIPTTDSLPALLAGNAVVLRPDPQTTLTMLAVAELLAEAGLPDGVLQVVSGGAEIGQAVVEQADYVAFTGSTAVGRIVGRLTGERLVGSSLELGGKNALYVRADADLPRAVLGARGAAFASGGQLCMHTERLLLHEAIADEFLDRFIPAVESMRIGTALEFGYDMGSLLGPAQLERTQRHIADALARGATLLAGGRHRPDLGPFVHEPTVLADVTSDMLCHGEETFGPVLVVRRVRDDDEAVALANDTAYGLNASIWSRDVRIARALARRVRTGSVNINEGYAATWATPAAPLGGRGQSGHGRRHGSEGILRYTESQTITAQHVTGFGPPLELTEERWAGILSGAFGLL
ncbi:MAG TPA: succinic semialdehyde dehydrogenase, partial [Dermatophilaceae bacterium]|nr:succinic semialdehyde dehydrogenase [Dermatophilaceae bacterium]